MTPSARGPKILLVDDDPAVLRGVSGLLRDEGFRTIEASDVASAEPHLAEVRDPPAMIVLDVRMPRETGLEWLARLPRPLPVPVVVLSGEASAGEAVEALRLGATDFVEKPPTPERLLTAVRNALRLSELAEERERLQRELAQPGNLVGRSGALERVRQLVLKVAPSDAVVLITGETGTGKERVARALHQASGRKGRFVAVNCAAIPAQLLESELFGYERGAFSGAAQRHIGRIEQAQRGTLLLDEIGDMPLELQAKLLRVLEQKEIERLGGTGPIPLEVRFVAATHQALEAAVRAGRFRQDLYYRLSVLPIAVPPLRERPDDIVPLAQAFADELGRGVPVELTDEAAGRLAQYGWPGNVRELRNFVERVVLLSPTRDRVRITEEDVATLKSPSPSGRGKGEGLQGASPEDFAVLGQRPYRELVDDFERGLITTALQRSGGNVAAAARLLQVDRGNLHRRMKALGMGTGDGDK